MSKRTKRVAHGEKRGIKATLGALAGNVSRSIRSANIIDLTLAANRTLTVSDVTDGDRFIVKAVSTCCGTLTLQVQGEGSSATAVVDVYDADACTATGFTDCATNYIIVDVVDASAGEAIAQFLIS
jgi:hypothetical protein